MEKCTFNYIEDKFRLTNPEKADYFNDLTLNIWQKISDSLLFKKVTDKKITFYLNSLGTKKRTKQIEYIDNINKEFNVPVITILPSDIVKVNVTPLFGEKTTPTTEILNKFNIENHDISKYLNQGLNPYAGILEKIYDENFKDNDLFTRTLDYEGNVLNGFYKLNYNSNKISNKDNPYEESQKLVNNLKEKIEVDYPGVNFTISDENNKVSFIISPGFDLLDKLKTFSLSITPTRGEVDKNIRDKYFSTGDVTTDRDILTKISQSNHPLNKVAEHLIPFSKGVKINLSPVNYIINNNIKSSGVYTTFGLGNEELIEIAEFSRFKGLGSEPTIIHEILHGLTVNWLDNINQSDPLYKEFERLYNETISKIGIDNNYGLTNIREFAVALFSDANFINKLKDLPSDNPTKYPNLFEEILNHILKLFKITDNKTTLYKDSFAVASNIINAQTELENTMVSNIGEFENLQDDIDNYYIDDYSEYTTELPEDLIQEEIITEEINIKPGVKELFESNPELANQVYEALGFKTVYQGYNVLDSRDINYYTIDKKEAANYGKNIRTVVIDIKSNLLDGTSNEYYNFVNQDQKLTNKRFDLLDNTKEGLIKQEQFFKFLKKQGYNGLDFTKFSDSQYVITFSNLEITSQQKQQALQAYSQYLNTIFPDSKVKDIVYHGSKYKFEKFDKSKLGSNTNPNKEFPQFNDSYLGFHFTSNPEYYRARFEFGSKYEKNLNEYIAILNIKNPKDIADKDQFSQNDISYIKSEDVKNNDSIIYDYLDKVKVDFSKGEKTNIYTNNYVVFEPEQIHILGNKQDIEGFKEFVNKPIVDTTLNINPNLIPDNIEEQFDEFDSLKNKDAETTDEFDKQILYSLILPNVSKDKFFEIFSQNNPEEFDNYRKKEVKRIINTFAEKFGITIEQINQYQDRYVLANNKTLSYNGVANLANKTIKYLEGDTAALTEEVAHFMIAMLSKNSPEYLALKNYITRTPEYQLYYESYLEVYNGDIDKTEEEIMGKVLANSLLGVTENAPLSLKSIITSILNYINNFFNPEYRKAFQRSVDNINHLFFTENFDTNFSEANISFDELYSLDFRTSKDEKVFNYSTDQILENILENLKNQRQRFIENKQTDLIKSIDTLIDIVTEKDSTINNSDKIINYVKMSLLEIQKVDQSLNDFVNSGILQDLESKNFNNLTKEQQEAQTQEDRANHLQYVAAAITTLQNLNSFINLIEWNFKGFNNTYQSLSDYNKIIDNLPDSYENKIFSETLSLTKASYRDAKLNSMKGVYQDLSQKLLDVTFKTLNTQDQKNFLELTQTNLTPNVKNQEDINNDISPLGTVKDLITGEFNISSFKENIMPLTFQKDVYLRSVDNANAVLRQFALMASAKDVHEYNLIQEKLNQLGVFDETWVSAKDDKNKSTFKLLQKYNFKLFKKSLAQKIITENLITLINKDVVLNEVENKDSKILQSIINKKYNSPNAIKDAVAQLYVNKKISKSLFLFLNNYINGYETLYTLKLSEQNNALSTNNQNILQKFKDDYIFQLENNLTNLNFNRKSLPYFNNKFVFTENTISASQLASTVDNIINNKRDALIKKFVVVPPIINGSENPVYTNQLAYVEGLMNYFKNNIGFLQDIEGETKTDSINYLMLGDEYFFNLSDKKSIPGINFVDKDYANLEKLAQSNNLKEKEIATLKLQAIEKIKQDNLKHNMPSNYLGGVLINNSAAFLSNSKEYREFYNRIFRMAFPLALTLASPVNPLSSVMLYLSYIGLLDTLVYKPIYFLRNDPTDAGRFKKAYNAWKLSLSEFFNKDLREKNIKNNTELEKEVAKGYKKIISNLIENIKNKLNKNRINDNILLLGEYKIPKPFEVERNNTLLLSTDFLSNQKSITQARYNYETNIRWESWIRMTADYNETRSGVTNSNIINTIKDRYWFNKFYKPGTSMNILRTSLGLISSKLLKGNIQSGLMNLTVGQFGVFLHTNPSTFAKSVINMFTHNTEMLYMGTNLNNVVNSFIGIFGNPSNSTTRLSFFDALKNMFLGKDTNVAKYNNNLIKHISKNLRKNRGTGFIEFDETESILTREFGLTSVQMINNLGEKFIEENTIFQYLNSNPIIDENGNPIKNLKKYLKIENGLLTLDKTKLPKNLYLKNTTNLAYKNYYNIDINSNVNIAKISPKDLGLNPLTDVELNEFLNITMSNDISNLMEKSQGVYNIFNKAYWRNTGIGLILFQFKDYILPSLTSTFGSKKIKNNFTSYETGVVNSLAKVFNRMAISGYKFIDKDVKFNKDVDQNLLILNNVSKLQFLKELNFLRKITNSFLFKSDVKINKKLREVASNNEKFRADTNRKTSSDILLNLPLSWYLKKIEGQLINDINFAIEGEFNLDINNPNYLNQLNYIKSLIDKKFKTKETIIKEDLDKLTKFDIDQNYFNIVQAYLKLKLNLTADVESINKLINFTALSIGVVMFLGLLKALEWPEEEEDEEGKKILNWKDWVLATGEHALSNLILNYIPYDIDDAYGIDYKNFLLEVDKFSPLLSQAKDIIKPITSIGYEKEMRKNMTSEKLDFLITVAEKNKGKLPLLKPKLVYNEETDEEDLILGSTLLKNELLKFPVNKEIINTFPAFAESKEKLEERKNKSLISLLAKKAIDNRAYKFGDRNPNQDPEKLEEQNEMLQELDETLQDLSKTFEENPEKTVE